MLRETWDLLAKPAMAWLLSALNAFVLFAMAVLLTLALVRDADNFFPPSRKWLWSTCVGLYLFCGSYVLRATRPFGPEPLEQALSIFGCALMAVGFFAAVGAALDAGVRLNRRLPPPLEPLPGEREWFQLQRRVLRRLYDSRRAAILLAAIFIADLVVLLLAHAVHLSPELEWARAYMISDTTFSALCFALIAIAMGVELVRFERDWMSTWVIVWCWLYVGVQAAMYGRVFGGSNVSNPYNESWFWLFKLVALVPKVMLIVGFAGIDGAVRFTTPAVERVFADSETLANTFLVREVSFFIGRHELSLAPMDDVLPAVAPEPRAALEGLRNEVRQNLDMLNLIIDAHFGLRGTPRSNTNEARDVDDVLDKFCSALARVWKEEKIEVKFAPAGAGEARIPRAELLTVVYNLLVSAHNRLHGTDKGCIQVTTSRMETKDDGPHVQVRVTDNGPPIEPATLEDMLVYPTAPGRAPGLWACRVLAARSGGRLYYEPIREGTSTVFVLDVRGGA